MFESFTSRRRATLGVGWLIGRRGSTLALLRAESEHITTCSTVTTPHLGVVRVDRIPHCAEGPPAGASARPSVSPGCLTRPRNHAIGANPTSPVWLANRVRTGGSVAVAGRVNIVLACKTDLYRSQAELRQGQSCMSRLERSRTSQRPVPWLKTHYGAGILVRPCCRSPWSTFWVTDWANSATPKSFVLEIAWRAETRRCTVSCSTHRAKADSRVVHAAFVVFRSRASDETVLRHGNQKELT